MTLRHDPDPSAADWVVRTAAPADGDAGPDADAWTRVLQGPPGFEAYATVRFDGEDADPYRPDPDLVALATRLAGRFTTTPDRAWFALWEGWGELEGGRAYGVMDQHRAFGRLFRAPRERAVPSAFGDDVLAAPRADLAGLRAYLLFTGPVEDVGAWGARPLAPDWPRDLPQASFAWPADHAWCVASDVDPTWFTVGGSQALVDAVLAHPDLAAEPATYGAPPRA